MPRFPPKVSPQIERLLHEERFHDATRAAKDNRDLLIVILIRQNKFKQALNNAEGDDTALSYILRLRGNYHWNIGTRQRLEKALKYHQEALRLATNANDPHLIMPAYFMIGVDYAQLAKLARRGKAANLKEEDLRNLAVDNTKIACKFFEDGQVEEKAVSRKALLNCGCALYEMGGFLRRHKRGEESKQFFTDAKNYLDEAKRIFVELDDKEMTAFVIMDYGELEEARDNWETAYKKHQQAFRMMRSIQDVSDFSLGRIYGGLGRCEHMLAKNSLEQGNFKKSGKLNLEAWKSLEKSKSIYDRMKPRKEEDISETDEWLERVMELDEELKKQLG